MGRKLSICKKVKSTKYQLRSYKSHGLIKSATPKSRLNKASFAHSRKLKSESSTHTYCPSDVTSDTDDVTYDITSDTDDVTCDSGDVTDDVTCDTDDVMSDVTSDTDDVTNDITSDEDEVRDTSSNL